MPSIDTPHGPIAYGESGSGPPIVFLHGLLCNGELWRGVVPRLSDRWRCIVPELPLGSHTRPVPDGADMTPRGLAHTILAFVDALALDAPAIVANDFGGALTQIAAAAQPARFGRLLLTSCDSFGQLPPRWFKPFALMVRLGAGPALVGPARVPAVQRFFWASVAHARPDEVVMRSYLGGLDDDAIVRDVLAIAREARASYMHDAARRLHLFSGRAIVAWGADDLWFARRNGRRLAQLLRARFELVDRARTFVPEDAPGRVAELAEELMA